MGRFDGVLLCSDYDNTLLPTKAALKSGGDPPPLSPGNRAAIETFMAQGGRFALATGRGLPALTAVLSQIPMNAPGILLGGAAVYDFSKKAYLETLPLPPEILPQVQEALDRFPSLAVESYCIDGPVCTVRPNRFTHRHRCLTGIRPAELTEMGQVPLPLGKVIFQAEEPLLQQVRRWFLRRDRAAGYEAVFSAPTLLEITAQGAHKGTMVRRLARHLGISMERVYCVGDGQNDLPMLRCAKQGFAPADCAPCVAESGAVLVSACTQDALADVIARLSQYAPA